MFRRTAQLTARSIRRFSSEITPAAKAENQVAKPSAHSGSSSTSSASTGGSTFFQRFSSFLAGCGVGFGVTMYFVYNELADANEKFSADIKELQNRIGKK